MLIYPNIDPVAFRIWAYPVHWYGLSYFCALLLCWGLLSRRLRRSAQPWPKGELSDLVFYVTLGVILGGRLGSIIYHPAHFLADPLWIVRLWEGGMSFHGGLLGTVCALWYFARSRGRDFFQVCDLCAPVVPLGLALGRVGNFINGELWGTPSTLPWAMVFPHVDDLPRHPSQLYQALLEGLLLFVLLWWYSSKPRPRMQVSGLFLIGYGACRSAVEWVREPDRNIGYLVGDWLTMGQVLSLPMLLAGALLLYLARQARSA